MNYKYEAVVHRMSVDQLLHTTRTSHRFHWAAMACVLAWNVPRTMGLHRRGLWPYGQAYVRRVAIKETA